MTARDKAYLAGIVMAMIGPRFEPILYGYDLARKEPQPQKPTPKRAKVKASRKARNRT